MPRVARLAQLAAVMAWIASGCSSSSKSQPSVVHSSVQPQTDAGSATGDGAVGSDGGDGGGKSSDAGVARSDGGAKPKTGNGTQDAGGVSPDAGQPMGCVLVSCPAPAICDESSGQAHCVCPAGYQYLDVGGTNPPCVAIDQCTDCDGG